MSATDVNNNSDNNTVGGLVPLPLLQVMEKSARRRRRRRRRVGEVRVNAAEMMGVPLYPDDLLEVRDGHRRRDAREREKEREKHLYRRRSRARMCRAAPPHLHPREKKIQ